VAGVPPDYFNRKGQLWGNPLHRWDEQARTGYALWIARLGANLERFDAVRLDHFIGFVRYYAVRAGRRDARRGRWLAGPGRALFDAVGKALGPVALIAEDLGAVTEEVRALRDGLGFPGMRVLQFAFGESAHVNENEHQPHTFPRRVVVYTGTHDNDTARGWFQSLGASAAGRRERARALRYLGSDGREPHRDLLRLAWASVADLSVAPLQDVLGLGSAARLNVPGRARGNWRWRVPGNGPGEAEARRLRELGETYGRARQRSGGAR
jgi:4-alpha-glucanotransferase